MDDHERDPALEPARRESGRWLGRAWAGVALVPVFFLVAFAVGEGTYALLGYKPEDADAPLWVDVAASALSLAVFVMPAVAAMYSGRRAVKAGEHRGMYPAVIGAAITIAWVTLTVVNQR